MGAEDEAEARACCARLGVGVGVADDVEGCAWAVGVDRVEGGIGGAKMSAYCGRSQ